MMCSIVPGAVPRFAPEQTGRADGRAAMRAMRDPQARGGVGEMPLPIVCQGNLPICTGVAAANARMILHYQQTGEILPFSGLFIYKMNRLFDGLPRGLRGSTLEASMQTLTYKGVCPERFYPSSGKNCARPFPADGRAICEAALPYRLRQYRRCDALDDILTALDARHPVAFSMVIYSDFFAARRGVVPEKRRGARIGGHSMVATDYDAARGLVRVLQSWGDDARGPTERGYMYIPFGWFDLIDELTAHALLIEAFALIE